MSSCHCADPSSYLLPPLRTVHWMWAAKVTSLVSLLSFSTSAPLRPFPVKPLRAEFLRVGLTSTSPWDRDMAVSWMNIWATMATSWAAEAVREEAEWLTMCLISRAGREEEAWLTICPFTRAEPLTSTRVVSIGRSCRNSSTSSSIQSGIVLRLLRPDRLPLTSTTAGSLPTPRLTSAVSRTGWQVLNLVLNLPSITTGFRSSICR